MIRGYFSFKSGVVNPDVLGTKNFNFQFGFVSFSDYVYQMGSISINFLVRRRNSDYFEEVLNKERQGENFQFSSCLSLLRDVRFQDALKTSGKIYVIYDELNNELSLIRDAFGTVPLFYHFSSNGIIFSTDLDDIVSHKEFNNPTEINTSRVVSYLTWLNNGAPHNDETFYKDIKNLLPGHFLLANRGNLLLNPIISFEPDKWKHLSRVEEYGEEFQYLFRKSVTNCIKNRISVSSHLSGGLDSSSVSSMIKKVAPDIALHTLYADTNTKLTDEARYARKVAHHIQSNHVIVHPSTDELELLIKNTSLYGFPEHMSISPSLQTGLIKTASSLHSQTLLTGTDGDSIVGHGMEYLNELYRQESWGELKIALHELAACRSGIGVAKNWDILSLSEKKNTVVRNFFYSKLSQLYTPSQAINLLQVARSQFNVGYDGILYKAFKGVKHKIKYFTSLPANILSSEIFDTVLPQQHTSTADSLSYKLANHYLFSLKDVFYVQAIALNEEKFYLARDHNIEMAYPFYDRELFEFNLAVPNKIKYSEGKGRGHFKEGMKGILIDEVRNRTDKGIFNEYGHMAAIRLYYQSRDFLVESNVVWDYVSKSNFNKSLKLLLSGNQPSYIYNKTAFFVTRTIYLSVWLNRKPVSKISK